MTDEQRARWSGGAAQRVRHRLKRSLPTTCELCGKMLGVDDTWDVDHVIPLNERPDLAFDLNNVRPVHARCNRRRGAGLVPDANTCRRGHELTPENTLLRFPTDARAARAWAAETGLGVAATGRVPVAVMSAWRDAGSPRPVPDVGRTRDRQCKQCARDRTREWKHARMREQFGDDWRPGPRYALKERKPGLLERGECPRGHAITSPADIRLGAQLAGGGRTETCRECVNAARRVNR